jgi:hypothetical protein
MIGSMKEAPLWPYVLSISGMTGFAVITLWLAYACTPETLAVCPELVCPLSSAVDVATIAERWPRQP